MRKFFLIFAIFVAFFSLSAQDNSNDLYQQYLNQYKKDQPAQAEQAKPAEAAPAQAETPAPAAQPAEEKKEEPAPAAQPAEEKKEEPAPAAEPEKKEETSAEEAPASEEKKEEAPAEGVAAAAEGDDDGGNKLAFERKPYFSVDTFGAMSVGIDVYGGSVDKDNSYRFGLDNAVVDLKGGDRMFNGRILFDLAKVTDEGNLTFNVLKDVSFRMEHPSYRSGNNGFGLDVNLQAGLFGLPFGIEGGYDHEITYMNSAIKEEFLGGAFRDLAVSLGLDFIFNPKSDLALTFFVFNGRNETMLDGQEDLFSAPAFGTDLRFNYESDFYATAALSFILGDAERLYEGGFAENGVYAVDEEGDGGLYYNVDGVLVSRSRSKKNILLAVGFDLGYNVNDNVSIGFKGEFAYSHRELYNPTVADQSRGNKLLFDGIFAAGSSYNPYGFFVMPYASLWDFDLMARFSYYKAPYYEKYIVDRDNTNMKVDFSLIYNFCDYAGVEFDYIFSHWTEHGYNLTGNKSIYTDKFNDHSFYLALTGWFDFLWEGKADAAE